ncbi:MAG TPA: hypothetical protein VN081_04300 [Dongiaceae bacterium]|nr:hypothetical protein [Dongiaceae bacterium]
MPVLTMVTRADFEAEKDTVGSFAAGEDGTVQEMEAFLCETYTLTVSVRESVAAAELPEWIRSQIGEGVAASDGEDNNEDSIVAIAEPDVEFLGAFEYEREMEVTYIASSEDGGELNDHIIEYRFYCEGQEIDKMRYSWVESMQTFESSALFDDISEMKRNDLGEITQDEICDIQEKFDSIIETIVVDKQFDDMEAIDDETGGLYLNEAEHCRRALGMLALVSRHIAGMRFRYPQSIDAEAVET